MSMHVTVSGKPVNIRRGKMVLSDLDQIKKNERDRRRRLRLEQVRQQSKEISTRLLERAKKIATEELSKLEKDGKSELRQIHDRKIMELQQKYQEGLENIGQAHALAALQPDADTIIEEERKKDRAAALKRGKEAIERMREAKQDSAETVHQERLRKVREVENVRASMVAKLPTKPISPEKNNNSEANSSKNAHEEIIHKTLNPDNKPNKIFIKKSPKKTKKFNSKEIHKILSPKPSSSELQKQKPVKQSYKSPSKKKVEKAECIIDDIIDDQIPRRTVPTLYTTPTKIHKVARYNPKDYTQNTSDSTSSISSSNSSSISDDSSYFSDNTEQITCNRTSRVIPLTDSKVRLYDYSTRQRNVYDRPLGIVERINIGNEPNAIEAAKAIKNAENVKMHMCKNHKINAQRRGEDAILREKVRRDYQALMENLDYLAQEERKLKASQIQPNMEEDAHTRLHHRDKYQQEHERKLNRTAKKILTTDDIPDQYYHLTERVVTLPTQRKSNVPHSKWQEPYPIEEEMGVSQMQQNKNNEISREEQILDMLKKVERQKRLLLQEFGSSLPNDIFNVSIRPLLDDQILPKTSQVTNADNPLSPEIKVINMSFDEHVKKDCVKKGKNLSKSPQKSEIAVQAALDKICHAENKAVQVALPQELPQEKINESYPIKKTVKTPVSTDSIESKITAETDDSSNDSSSSEINEMVIKIDKKEVIVTPKKRKSNMKVWKRLSPRIYQKTRSTVSSKATSSIKKFSRPCLINSQKKTKCIDTPDTASRRIDIHMNEFALKADPLQETRMSIDASTESSQTVSSKQDSSKPCQIRTQMKRWIRIKDTSDTSTSFASPPPIKPKSFFDTLTNVTPILEILNSKPEELKLHDISPISTPETPSPRTMMIPSNIIHCDRLCAKMLRYNSIATQINNDISTIQSDKLIDTSISCQTELKFSTPLEKLKSSRACTCKSPTCKLQQLDDMIHDYALKNCPKILQKYEDLQKLCAERIASLTNLIEKVRCEQKGIDLSLISPRAKSTMPMNIQLPIKRPAQNDMEGLRKLVENIEIVHAQFVRTLAESQKLMETTLKNGPCHDAEVQVISTPVRSKSIDTIDTAHIQKFELINGKAKPKIVSDERVNIQLNQFKIQPRAITSVTTTSNRNSWPPCTFSLHEEEMIEKLSKEILEQSKHLDKASTAFASPNGDNEIFIPHKVSIFKDASSCSSSEHEKDNSIARESTSIQETRKENDSISIISTPKISRNHGTATSISARLKPPVTLLNGLYRPELESSGHELSTIVEFDIMDTVNKNVKSPTKSKPSVHVAPLSVQQHKNSSKKLADSISDVKHSVKRLSPAQAFEKKSQKPICISPGKLTDVMDCVTTKTETKQEHTFVKCNKELQCNTITEELVSQTKDKLGSSTSTDPNNHKDSKHKTTSTSLYSFSGLSGISEITSSPSSDVLKYSSPEEMETALKKLGLGWAVATLKKTREASALSSSSNSDVTPVNTARRMISPTKKHHDPNGFPEISDVSSISIKEASKSTEHAVLLKARTSTPKLQNSNSSERSSITNTYESIQDPSDSLTMPNVSLIKTKSDNKQLQSP